MVKFRKPNCRSLRDLFITIIVVASISVFLTHHISKHLMGRDGAELKFQIDGRVDFFRDIQNSEDIFNTHLGRKFVNSVAFDEGQFGKVDLLLAKKIHQIEESMTKVSTQFGKIAIVKGQSVVLDRDLPLFKQSLTKAGFSIKIPSWYQPGKTGGTIAELEYADDELHFPLRRINGVEWEGSSLLLCLAINDGDNGLCLERESYGQLESYQKVNRIPGFKSTLWRRDSLCQTLNIARQIPTLRNNGLIPLCFVLPEHLDEFLTVAKSDNSRWVFKTSSPGNKVQILQPWRKRDEQKIRRMDEKRVVVEKLFENPLLLYGLPCSVRAFVLITSVSPLRVYIHQEGIVQYRNDHQRHFEKLTGRTWSFEQFKQYLAQTYNNRVAEVAFKNIESVIVQTLLVAESSITSHFTTFTDNFRNPYRCQNCFQLLEFELVLNSSFHPVVVQINGQPDLSDTSKLENWSTSSTSPIIDDMIAMVTAVSPSVSVDIIKALKSISSNINIAADCSNLTRVLCLTPSNIEYLVSWRRECVHKGHFKNIYPSSSAEQYSTLLEELYRFLAPKAHDKKKGRGYYNTTPYLHSTLVQIAKYFHSRDCVDTQYDDLNVPLFPENKRLNGASTLIENIHLNESRIPDKYTRKTCSNDESVMSLLEGIYTEPPLTLTPAFQPEVTEYYANVPYHVFLVKMWAHAQNCDCEARLEEKYGLSRPSNFTLGLGSNRLSVLVVDLTHSEPWVLNTYTITVYRAGPEAPHSIFENHISHSVCSIVQDCDLAYDSALPCGLQKTVYKTWGQYQEFRSRMPKCTTGDVTGRWMVPCTDCSSYGDCYWGNALWQPYSCTHKSLPREKLKSCLSNKKVLFLGDSTNRGIMHYVMEQVNDSLAEWDKTHNLKVYNNLNGGDTTVTFAYYPQFWLPANERPVFDKSLYQLMKVSSPLENNNNTVLVVGGVHWLATHHLNVVLSAIKREGLNKAKLVMKSLGSGFHQPVDGLHCLTLHEQKKLANHNSALVRYGQDNGFSVVDTFGMTMARYKDFLQGKCACHFHTVREVLPSFSKYMKSTGSSKLTDMPIHYHVEGEINAMYSEMVLNSICDD